jgi:hypothetical protein
MESTQALVDVPAATTAVAPAQTQKFSLFALTMMVVGSMVGDGIFSLPRAFGNATGPFGAIVAWAIAAGGMYTLTRVFQALAERKPDLDAGVYAYAKAGFGDYLGFLPALGNFASAWPWQHLLLGPDQIDSRRFFPDLHDLPDHSRSGGLLAGYGRMAPASKNRHSGLSPRVRLLAGPRTGYAESRNPEAFEAAGFPLSRE